MTAPSGQGRWGFRLWVALCLAIAAIDLVFHRHVVHPAESMPGFYSLYGFIACVALVLVARTLRRSLMRSEDYYDAE